MEMNTTAMRRPIQYLFPLIPYIAVAIGMYGLRSAWGALALYHIGALAVVLLYWRRNIFNREARYASPFLSLTVIVYAAGGFLFYLLWPYVDPGSSPITDKLENFGVNKHMWPYFAVYFCIVNSMVEELFWRGYLGSNEKQLHPNDFFFGGYHVLVILAFTNPIWGLPVFAACAFAGWLWRMLHKITGNLALPIATHLVADVAIALAVYFRAFA